MSRSLSLSRQSDGVLGKTLLFVLFVLHPLLVRADPVPHRYRLEQRKISLVSAREEAIRLVLREGPEDRILWQHTVREVECLAWSKDHRALAMSLYDPAWGFRLFLWRAGEEARLVRYRTEGRETDGILDLLWSGDRRHLLFRTWGSGGKDMNTSTLWCLDVKRGRQTMGPWGVRRMQWLSNHRVRYWKLKFLGKGTAAAPLRSITDPKPRLWRCPS
jgi:hypothetical protein